MAQWSLQKQTQSVTQLHTRSSCVFSSVILWGYSKIKQMLRVVQLHKYQIFQQMAVFAIFILSFSFSRMKTWSGWRITFLALLLMCKHPINLHLLFGKVFLFKACLILTESLFVLFATAELYQSCWTPMRYEWHYFIIYKTGFTHVSSLTTDS